MAPETTSRHYYRRLASQAGLRFVSLDERGSNDDHFQQVNPLAARLLSEEVCRRFGILPVSYMDGVVTIAASDPFDVLAREVTHAITGRDAQFVVAAPDDIGRAQDELFVDPEAIGNRPVASEPGLPAHEHGAVAPPARLGELLVARGLATEVEVAEALAEQERAGDRLGEVLVCSGVMDEQQLISVLAEQFQLPLVDLSEYEPDPEALTLIPEPLARQLRCVPLAAEGGILYLAIPDILGDETVAALREHTHLELRGFLATRTSIDELLRRLYGDRYVTTAKEELLTRFPGQCANRVVSDAQKVFLIAFSAIFILLLIVFPVQTLIVFVAASSIFYTAASLYRFKLTYNSLGHQYEVGVTDAEVASLDERDLPKYTILVPLYHEAAALSRLVGGLGGLDYPRTKLDIRLLCEEDDDATPNAIRALNLPPHFKLIVVPDAQPKTKPKACNYGLLQAEGEIVVVYDAEDRPDPDQLKKVVLAFQKADPGVTCIQARLNYFNQDQNLLTRWLSTEYSVWFDLLLPGLDASGAPIPLGGTSSHFVKSRLLELAAWDPFNVTENADLGIRLHAAGYETAMIDSMTLEEANPDLDDWIRRRSRWIKGYIQTYLVHMRNPFRLIRQIGFKGFLSFQLLIGGTFILLLNPILWALTTAFFLTEVGLIQLRLPGVIFYAAAFQLFIGNLVFMYLNVAGSVQRGYFEPAKHALLSPLYWGLMSIAAWKGFLQLCTSSQGNAPAGRGG